MKSSYSRLGSIVFAAVWLAVGYPVSALEVVTEEDIIEGVVVEDQLVRLADNAIFLIDTSSSMNDEFQDRGQSKLELALSAFKLRNSYFPEIGHRFGLYRYTPWEVVYPVQTYDREAVAAALDTVPSEGSGSTPLAQGIENAAEIIGELSGRTVLFVFYDGNYSGRNPDPNLWQMVRENDVCVVFVSSAPEQENEEMRANMPKLNSCSRLVHLEDYLDRPEYLSGALFDVRATEQIVTRTESRVVGVDVENILFDFDTTELTAADRAELDEVAQFMATEPASYAVIAGYTDNIGIEDYNEHLSQLRAEMVARYLMDVHGIDETRLVLHWHGSDNPIADNGTDEGRAQNRRVEVAIGGV